MFKNHPKGLLLAALSNMGERFGYYIMNAVLVLFLCSKFGLSDETSGLIAAIFLAAIYVLSLAGGAIADRTQNYKATISWGLVIMALGYAMLSVPILSTPDNISWLLPLTVFALAMIACGNGLFKGNLQAIVGQMYDDFEAEAAKQGPDRLKWAQGQRDAGFQIFYVFINVGALVAPFIAPLLRSWWLSQHGLVYNADLPKLCHAYINSGGALNTNDMQNLTELVGKVGGNTADLSAFCSQYLDVFNTGIHYSFIASVVMMLVSLAIFVCSRKLFPTPGKKETVVSENYSEEERRSMAKEIKQRMSVCRTGHCRVLLVLVPPERTVALVLCSRLREDRFHSSRDMAGCQSAIRHRAHACHHVDFQPVHKAWQAYLHSPQDSLRYGYRRHSIPLAGHLLYR